MKQTDDIGLAVINTEIDGCPAYDTNDIVEKHPLDPTLFHIVGRYDDLIILQTGRKVEHRSVFTIKINCHSIIQRQTLFPLVCVALILR